MLNCRYILKIVPFPPQGPKTTIQFEHSPKCLAQNQDKIKNVEVYTHSRICAIPPPGPKDNNLTPPKVDLVDLVDLVSTHQNVWLENHDSRIIC